MELVYFEVDSSGSVIVSETVRYSPLVNEFNVTNNQKLWILNEKLERNSSDSARSSYPEIAIWAEDKATTHPSLLKLKRIVILMCWKSMNDFSGMLWDCWRQKRPSDSAIKVAKRLTFLYSLSDPRSRRKSPNGIRSLRSLEYIHSGGGAVAEKARSAAGSREGMKIISLPEIKDRIFSQYYNYQRKRAEGRYLSDALGVFGILATQTAILFHAAGPGER